MAISHPTDPAIRGLAAALLTTDVPDWEFDPRAIEPGTEPVYVSDWHRRLARARRDESTAAAVVAPVKPRETRGDAG